MWMPDARTCLRHLVRVVLCLPSYALCKRVIQLRFVVYVLLGLGRNWESCVPQVLCKAVGLLLTDKCILQVDGRVHIILVMNYTRFAHVMYLNIALHYII